MKFCEVCANMLYVTIDKDNGLKLYCKNCNFSKIQEKKGNNASIPISTELYDQTTTKELLKDDDDLCIMNINYSDDARSYRQFMTPDIKYDMTLPRVNNIPCPSSSCKGQVTPDSEVIYIKYDHDNMKYLYFCCKCDHFWRLEE